MRRIERLINHWTVTGPETTVAELDAMHRAKGWRGIGYHRVILHPAADPKAQHWWNLVKPGRTLNDDLYLEAQEVGAHAFGYNGTSVGIVTVGRPGQPLHELQRRAIIETNRVLCGRFKLPRTAVCGHRDVNPTECPGGEIYQLIREIRDGKHF